MTLRFIRPVVPEPERWRRYLDTAYEARWFSNFGDLSVRLEQGIATHYGGRRTVLTCANGTIAIAAALMALRITGRVALPAFTFSATLQAVLAAGAEPVLVDVDPDSWALTPESMAPAWCEGLDAVLAVRPFGLCHDFSALEQECEARGVPLVIDAAAALGGCLPTGEHVGGQGDMEVFSLHATKVFAVGEGGAIFAAISQRPQLIRALNFGLDQGVPQGRALNGKFSEFHAAVGLAMLDVFDAHVARRRELAQRYREALSGRVGASFALAAGQPVWQAFPLCLNQPRAKALIAAANEYGVELRGYYSPALTSTPLAAFARALACPQSEALAERMVCLPLYSDMTDAESDTVIEAVVTAAREAGCAPLA